MNKQTIKRALTFALWFCAGIYQAQAQNELDALRFFQNRTYTSARVAALSGAFTALGGDIGSIERNPAGMALIRSSILSLGPSITSDVANTQYLSSSNSEAANSFRFNQLGFVSVKDQTAKDPNSDWKFISYGFNYQTIANFNLVSSSNGINRQSSLVDRFLYDANNPNYPFSQQTLINYFPFTANLAYNTYLINPDTVNKYFWSDIPRGGVGQVDSVVQKGSIGEFTFTVAANYKDKWMLGGSVFGQSLSYSSLQTLREYDVADTIKYFNQYKYEQQNTVTGFGIGARIGIIYAPIKKFRVGLNISTPVYFYLTDQYRATIKSDMQSVGQHSDSSSLNQYNYSYQQPWKFGFGVGWFPKANWVLSADIDFLPYQKLRMFTSAGNSADQGWADANNRRIDSLFTISYYLRLGSEYRLGERKQYALRAGFSYQTTPIAISASVQNADQTQLGFSLGAGWKTDYISFDIAYALHRYQAFRIPYTVPGLPESTEIQTIFRNQILLSVTFRL